MKAAKITRSNSIINLVLLLMLLPFSAVVTGAIHPNLALARAQDISMSGSTQANNQKLEQPATPLEKLLNEDGTLNLNSGFKGSVDPAGWEMTTGPDQRPRFVRAEVDKAGKTDKTTVTQAPLDSGDENWDDRFGLLGVNGDVEAIAISGSDVYVGGDFRTAGGVNANDIVRWDGNQWYSLGSGVNGSYGVYAIGISGSDVYVGGGFTVAGDVSAHSIARWDGSQWYPLGSGTPNGLDYGSVYAIGISGSDVYVGGWFTTVGDVSARRIARWDGNEWYSLGSGVDSIVSAIGISGSDVYVGGDFDVAGHKLSEHFGIWHAQVLEAHMTWQGRPSQPDPRLQIPVTLTLKSSILERNYPSQGTSSSAILTTDVSTLLTGTYIWRAKTPKYLANSGTVTLTGAPITNLEMGLMRAGDANNDNVITALDFNIVKSAYGKGIGDPGYDDRADFNGDQLVTILDFNLLKVNFGQGGAPPIGPGGR